MVTVVFSSQVTFVNYIIITFVLAEVYNNEISFTAIFRGRAALSCSFSRDNEHSEIWPLTYSLWKE